MKKVLLALLVFGLVSQASASELINFDGVEIRLADPSSFTSRFADAPGHRLYHMYAENGFHFETRDTHVNRWVSFDANYETARTANRVGFNFRVESVDNRIKDGYVIVYNEGRFVTFSRISIIRNQDCVEIRPSLNDEAEGSTACGSGHSNDVDAEAILPADVSGDKYSVWLIGEKDANFAPQISEFKMFGLR